MTVRVRGRRPGGKLGCGEAGRWQAQTRREGVDTRGCLYADDVGDEVAQAGGGEGGEAERRAEARFDLVAGGEHDRVVEEAEADEEEKLQSDEDEEDYSKVPTKA